MEEGFELYILDEDFASTCLVDSFESMIWTDRYCGYGDFELYLSANSDVLVHAVHGHYIWNKNSDRLMIIETTEITTDVEKGSHLKITGRSLESILDRRIIWHQTTVEGKVQTVIKKLITDAIISPALSTRAISNFVFIDSSDPYIDSCEIDKVQYLGDNLYDVVIDILGVFNIGYKIIYNFDAERFEFGLFYGKDRSYDQDVNPWVVFSPEFDNIISSNFLESTQPYKNVNLVAGEDKEGKTRKFVYVDDSSGDIAGLHRREMFTDGSSKNQEYKDENDQDVVLTDAQYIEVLKNLGLEEVNKAENRIGKSFEGEMNTTHGFYYGVDFDIGDVVQTENEYGLGAPTRVVEFILSQDVNGIKQYPTFDSSAV